MWEGLSQAEEVYAGGRGGVGGGKEVQRKLSSFRGRGWEGVVLWLRSLGPVKEKGRRMFY